MYMYYIKFVIFKTSDMWKGLRPRSLTFYDSRSFLYTLFIVFHSDVFRVTVIDDGFEPDAAASDRIIRQIVSLFLKKKTVNGCCMFCCC